ncbi:MAG: AAA family ATPase [Chloroflexi bacterium]|jgi:CO dehydrogenase maturation factor|nr:AAA family ATPase [Chloroflexota bacterium]MBT7082357.1 AAA family ATPase [Chloroflexota bacterium]MBT7289099.1 AAA family ATPase [Chloroflexota bacterium]
MKLAITGKGGVGKTTLSSLLARLYASEGRKVTAIEANLDQNLAMALGFTPEEAQSIKPIAELTDLIEERTGARPGTHAPLYKLNPKVDDIAERFSLTKNGVRLLLLGAVKTGGSGCFCPESALLKTLMTYLILGKTDVLIMDMDAGVEHMSRGTTESVDAFIIVVEPGKRSLATAETIRNMASDLGIKKCYIVGNKITSDKDKQFIRDNSDNFEVLGFISLDDKVREADLQGISAFDTAPKVLDDIKAIKDKLQEISQEKNA